MLEFIRDLFSKESQFETVTRKGVGKGQTPVARSISDGDRLVTTFADAKGNYTTTETSPHGTSMVVDTGKGWELING